MKCDDYRLASCRDQVFDNLFKYWNQTKAEVDFWLQANTLTTVAQYWSNTSDSTRRKNAMSIMVDGYNFYLKNKDNMNWWVDDFGWWGGFFFDLQGYTGGLQLPPPFDQANLVKEAKYCFTRMQANKDKTYCGIWNAPSLDDRYCRKNSITNSWYFSLATSLSNYFPASPEYKTEALNQYTWLTTGKFGSYAPPPGTWSLYSPAGVLRETPRGPHTRGPNSGPPDDWFWSGDNGVYLRALLTFIIQTTDPNAKKQLLLEGQRLIKAATVRDKAIFVDGQNVMHESPSYGNYDPTFAISYVTGKGVFMRHVTRFAMRHDFADAAFKDFVNTTAQSVWCSRDKNQNVISRNWNPPLGPPEENDPLSSGFRALVLQTGGLDALNAAVRITEPAEHELLVAAGTTT